MRLRRSSEGGAAFLPAQALTVELDTEALTLLSWLDRTMDISSLRVRASDVFGRNFIIAEIDRLLIELEEMGVVQLADAGRSSTKYNSRPKVPDIEVPECVHLELTNSCNQRCPSCYLPLRDEHSVPLSFDRLIGLVDELSDIGVFQLALGGGEPLMSPYLVPVVRHARNHGLLPNVTTNGSLITDALLDNIAGYVGEIRLSCNDGKAVPISWLTTLVMKIKRAGVAFGFNLIVTRPGLPKLRDILAWLSEFEPTSLVLVRPKPGPTNRGWYNHNALSPEDCLQLGDILAGLAGELRTNALALDCAFSFFFSRYRKHELRQRGVQGCAGGKRFCVVKWNGDVYPCSHLYGDAFRIGSVAVSPFADVWRSPFEKSGQRLRKLFGPCGVCVHKPACGGCRAIALYEYGNAYATDPSCPTLAGLWKKNYQA